MSSHLLTSEDEDYQAWKFCQWSMSGDKFADYWDTGCGNTFYFSSGGIEENNFKFCPYCGKPIAEADQ